MASLSFSQFLSFPSLFPRRHNCHRQLHQQPHDLCRFRASSISKSRRKAKTNAELCDDIREFVAANGLPEGCVPTVKEFSQLGRSDLAYIVRRRGYKLIGELLNNTEETALSGFNAEKAVAEENDAFGYSEDNITGQYEKAGDIMVDRSTSFVDVPAVGSSSDSLVIGAVIDSDDDSHVGPPFDSSNHSQEVPIETDSINDRNVAEEASSGLSSLDIDAAEDGLQVAKLSIEENCLASSDIIGSELTMVASTNLSADWSQTGLHENINMNKEVSLATEAFINEPLPSSVSIDHTHNSDEHRAAHVELSSMSLEDKVANFMQHGHLDTIEESDSDGTLKESGIEEGNQNIEWIDEVKTVNATSADSENMRNGGNSNMNFNGSALTSIQVVTATTESNPLRDANLLVEAQNSQFNKDLDDKTSKRDNNVEINHLKFMLHEKELELSRLREEIEKEKRALSLLQAKAETEISKAQKLISEKDAELLAAEEMLSELVEVQIRYHGNGEIVEVAGSFNGWHHWIKMDPQPSSSTTDPVESRKPKVWSTMLWLYPGIYEIKFIVDGDWRIHPRMESVSNGTICNNILRVHR